MINGFTIILCYGGMQHLSHMEVGPISVEPTPCEKDVACK